MIFSKVVKLTTDHNDSYKINIPRAWKQVFEYVDEETNEEVTLKFIIVNLGDFKFPIYRNKDRFAIPKIISNYYNINKNSIAKIEVDTETKELFINIISMKKLGGKK